MNNLFNVRRARLVGLFCTFLTLGCVLSTTAQTSPLESTGPTPLSFDDLSYMAQQYQLPPDIQARMETVLATPFIYNNPAAIPPQIDQTRGIQLAEWNINRGFYLPQIITVFDPAVEADPQAHLNTSARGWEEKKWLAQSSILLFSEVDYGMKRTGYQNIPEILAQKLNMNAAYGVEFFELSPLSKRFKAFVASMPDPENYSALGESFDVDASQYKGMHGDLVLSKYPILKTQVLRLPQCYDWYNKEQNQLSSLEHARRSTSKHLFRQKVLTEIRRGGRMGLIVDLAVPQIPEGVLTVASVHIEDRTRPECRRKQLAALLQGLKGRRNPVVVGGDFNTSEADTSPTSAPRAVIRRLNNTSFYGKRVLQLFTPFTFVTGLGLDLTNHLRTLYNPTLADIPVILPNLEYKFYKQLKEFRFDDGTTFDLRGDAQHAYNQHHGFLTNANERQYKGFVPTFSFQHSLLKGLIGRYKLDWFLVKAYTHHTNNPHDSYTFAPTMGRTLRRVNTLFSTEPISDHEPLTVTLQAPNPSAKL